MQEQIVACVRCPRLVVYRQRVAQVKVRRFRDWTYWGRPVPSFGDPQARLLILGLAPAAHGGNRTGRVFTGDDSGHWVARALYETGFANQPTSEHRDDGLRLADVYITALLHCAPPANRPLASELTNCAEYWTTELQLLPRVCAVLSLGRLAFDHYLARAWRAAPPRPQFQHGASYDLGPGQPRLFASYHPSRQNTQTRRLVWGAWLDVFRRIRAYIDGQRPLERSSRIS